jgi:predicted nuclease with TOPRIM domain
MIWAETISIIVAVATVGGFILNSLRNFKSDMHLRYNCIETRMQINENKFEERMESFEKKLQARMEAFEKKLEERMGSLERKFDRLQETVTDIDRRLCRLEGAFTAKDCCMIKDHKHIEKVE